MYKQDLNSAFLSPVQTDATFLDQKCYILRPFAHPVACCCVLLGVVAQSVKPPVKLLPPCKGTQLRWELLRPFSRNCNYIRIGSFTVRTIVKVNLHF